MIKVGIVGGTGYTGVELLRLLSTHPEVELTAITSRKEDGLPVAEMYPSLRGRVKLAFSAPEKADLLGCDVVFFATPHGVAMAQARELLAAGVKVIDLAADFRMQDVAQFEKWYGIPHSCTDVLKQAVYGLPELNRAAIKTAKVIGNPGCYPTTMQLGYHPLLKAGVIDAASLIADCKSGVSGAGRKAEIGILFSETSDSFKAYAVSGHRHTPETVEQLQRMSADKVELLFTPHLVPMIRGMHSTLYARLKQEISNEALQALFEQAYQDEPFVDVMPFGSHPDTRSTRASNMLRIAIHRPNNGNTVVVLVVQDNLVKGASGQAVQCMNLMFGLDETCGLLHVPVLP
ncbi:MULTISPECIES: N-acetyl-gamma-glutamyl-phosphate reductase [unclassified Undibacterium]|uniref:N-acetyl-gamma-glutamyl-phosphate reductase n=1 Tax=unclassified Undibacterium TaxID=2630295 RepID=UPI002AC94CC7|nr:MULTISPECIES: N-acetyl-gamma-glutamyl-phosphate reductase [unclassified Undibacterium]MEB0137938.1 N-acetyl-gamma-glutamyl-phosphate reductase [Undibacterium sp. CCC2.1]MEB0172058.1 N-acetyl-gamma-glutamyl-phosphate reductase [Undibacterium sp. CCC1.1]MEB0174946.1 N-acetyl-gamma-glutamyl-phosphate reductase [Undibacterium sp. CCC3.4]MEB0214846.1 N-acetyl-gamma-glutamyl-phosphate reductase [Undibacterium sp. 5I2]WPX45390.1 N-acetyl-gamma-glutamyl-phosphate reductase [Undibacterium sp. CCC3.4